MAYDIQNAPEYSSYRVVDETPTGLPTYGGASPDRWAVLAPTNPDSADTGVNLAASLAVYHFATLEGARAFADGVEVPLGLSNVYVCEAADTVVASPNFGNPPVPVDVLHSSPDC